MLPSTEDDADPTFSFSAPSPSDLGTPAYLRADSLPPSGVPPRLQSRGASFADSPSSAASSPCAASADLSVDSDRFADFADASSTLQLPDHHGSAGDHSPVHQSIRRALMGGAADFPQRSSSPLKRRASSMEPEQDLADAREDVDMLKAPEPEAEQAESADLTEGAKMMDTQEEMIPEPDAAPPAEVKAALPLRNGDYWPTSHVAARVRTLC